MRVQYSVSGFIQVQCTFNVNLDFSTLFTRLTVIIVNSKAELSQRGSTTGNCGGKVKNKTKTETKPLSI